MKAFFIDIDGTLANDDKVIPKENLKAIKEAQSHGDLVFINTGRALVPPALRALRNRRAGRSHHKPRCDDKIPRRNRFYQLYHG